jgi:hypothetical protein
VIGDTKELYASLFSAAGGLTKDLPSSENSLQHHQYQVRSKNNPFCIQSDVIVLTWEAARGLGNLQGARDMCIDLDPPY